APQNVQYAAPYPQQFEDDTIDLYELWITLWNKKWLVIAVTAIAALGSVVYALQQTPIYKTEALLLPPRVEDLKSLNFPGVPVSQMVEPREGLKGEYGIGVNAVFDKFKNNLSSRSLQKKFIQKYDLLDILAPNRTPETRDIEIFESFSKMIKVENGENLSVSMESGDPEFAAKLINDYVSFFDFETVLALVAAARNSIESQIRDIEYTISSKRQMAVVLLEDEIREIETSISSKRILAKIQREDEIKNIQNTIRSKRQMAKQRREDKILLYEEAAFIASKLGVKDRVDTTNEVQKNQLNISTIGIPLYNRGYKALREEIGFLKNRKSDDPFITGLRDLQEKLELLRSRKSDDTFIYGLRDLQLNLSLLRS
ncbi:MAG TPA: hypothetical protein EYO60_09110, partial [Candidatus Lambdaproteobacteria bacterium]|nr:hypothetical protein [Candidatus Lambdaproteobacteria bacterium]